MPGELWQSVSLYTPLKIVAAFIAADAFEVGIERPAFKANGLETGIIENNYKQFQRFKRTE